MIWLLIFSLGGLGACLRFFFSTHLNNGGFPLGTFLVNVLGALAIGYLFVSPLLSSAMVKMALMAGFLGALTTFSSYSLELVTLLEKGKWGVFSLYFFLSHGVGLSFCWLGMKLGRA